ncbi:MAG: hypothetical protein ACK58T_23910 [Phycisphaerae bacterium]
MVSDHKEIDLSDRIPWRHELSFDVPGQVTAGEKSEISEREEQTQAGGIV